MTAQRTRHIGYGIWLILASVVGWWAAFQLTMDKFISLENPKAELGCNLSFFVQCGANLESWQGSVFGFPNPIIGLTGWMAVLVMGVAVVAGARFPRWFWGVFGLGITAAFAFIAWLIWQTFFALHTLFGETARLTAGPLDVEYPVPGSLEVAALAITVLGFALIFWRRWSVLRTLGACALVGVVVGLATSL